MIRGLLTFILVISLNIFYVYYFNSLKNNKTLVASFWSMCINLSSNLTAICFVKENWIIIPCCLGSFVGTYIGSKMMDSQKTSKDS